MVNQPIKSIIIGRMIPNHNPDLTSYVYESIVYGTELNLKGLDVIQNAWLRVCLGALESTWIERREVEAWVSPLRLRRGQQTLIYATKIARKPYHPNGNVQEGLGARHFTIDTLVHSNIAPWETPTFTIVDAWLPSVKAMVWRGKNARGLERSLANDFSFLYIYI